MTGEVRAHPRSLHDGRHRWATASGGAELAALTAREREVLALIGSGKTNKEIASALFVSEGTVKTHVNHVFANLGCVTAPPP